MTHNQTGEPAKPIAERVLKVCLIICTAVGLLVIILKVIRGDNFFDAASTIVPASLLVVRQSEVEG